MKIYSFGGTNTSMCTRTFIVWLSITTLFPVCLILLLTVSILTTAKATSVAVERVFSQGRLVLPYIRNRLSAESIRALMCLGDWSLRGLVKDADVTAAAVLPDVDGEEPELNEGWDKLM
jgi:hypothetical protein